MSAVGIPEKEDGGVIVVLGGFLPEMRLERSLGTGFLQEQHFPKHVSCNFTYPRGSMGGKNVL